MKPGPDTFVINQNPLISRRTAGLLLGSCLVTPAKALASVDALTDEIIARSQLSTGDLARLMNVFARAARGEPITLGVIGGSIKPRAFSPGGKKTYAARLPLLWRRQITPCPIRTVTTR